MTRRRSVTGLLALAAAAAMLLSGCSGFPARGPVVEGRRVEAAGSGLQSFADPPRQGGSPEVIVDGFLRAGEDVHEDHKIAREYLASPQSDWRPEEDVVILDGPPQLALESASARAPRATPASAQPPRVGDTASVRVTGRVLARVDSRGLMTLPSAGVPATLDVTYHLVYREDRQWRIDGIPPNAGLVLTDEQFRSGFRSVSLYFADATGRWLVPDLRWFPDLDAVDPAPTALLVVSALLQGPAPWLGQAGPHAAVTTGAVSRTELTAVGGVRIEDDVVHVDLDSGIRRASPEQRRLLQAQLDATMRDFVGASQVVLTAGQAALDVPAAGGPGLWPQPSFSGSAQLGRTDAANQGRQDQRGFGPDPEPLCLTVKNRVGELDTSQRTPACRERKDLAGLGAGVSLPTEDAAGRIVAGLQQGGGSVVAVPAYVSPSAQPQQVLTGPGLAPPSIDNHGWIWSAAQDGRVLAGRLGDRQREVTAPWLAGAGVEAVRISPEGARALLLVSRGGSTQAWITGVARLADGTPVGFSAGRPLRVVGDLTRAVDAGWSDAGDVVVLGSQGDQHLYVLSAQVGGGRGQPLVGRWVPDNATGLAVSGSVNVYVRTADRGSYASVVGEWKKLSDVRDLTLPN